MHELTFKINDLMNDKLIKDKQQLAAMLKVKYEDLCFVIANPGLDHHKKILKKLADFFAIPVSELIQDNRLESIYIPEKERYHANASEVLKYLMHDIGDISEGELFRRTGVPQPTIHRIISGATPNPRLDSIEPLAQFFNITPDQMLARVPLPFDRIPGTFVALTETKKVIPLLNWTEVVDWPHILKKSAFKMDRTWMSSESNKKVSFALKIFGDEYYPDFRKGTILLFETQRHPQSGDFALGIFKKNQEIFLGQIVIQASLMHIVSLLTQKKSQVGHSVDVVGIVAEARHQF